MASRFVEILELQSAPSHERRGVEQAARERDAA